MTELQDNSDETSGDQYESLGKETIESRESAQPIEVLNTKASNSTEGNENSVVDHPTQISHTK